MADPQTWPCHACGNVGLTDGFDGFFYCLRCGSQADDIIDTGVADEDLVQNTGGAIYLSTHTRRTQPSAIKAEPISQSQPHLNPFFTQSQLWNSLNLENDPNTFHYEATQVVDTPNDGVGPTVPEDFGLGSAGFGAPSFDDYSNEVKMRYLMGLQLMIEFQCEVLVREFKVNPLICGLAATFWLRFVASTKVFEDDWAYHTIQDSESQQQGDPQYTKPLARHRAEPHTLYGQRAIMVWFRALRKRIPLSCTLAISFLACHVAREAILPTDIMRWSLEGKLPYFAAFIDIEKQIGQKSSACPISSRSMFMPSRVLPLQKLESLAASVAHSIGLSLPPVNFYAIASRYLNKLSLPVEKILPHACRLHMWSMPANLWLSSNELRLPTRVCVMSILIIAMRIVFNIHGFGEWEKSLDDSFTNSVRDSSHVQESDMDTAELLQKLEVIYNQTNDTYEYTKDLSSYLQFCKDIVFAGMECAFEDHEEEKIIEQFWDYYQKQKDSEPAEEVAVPGDAALDKNRARGLEAKCFDDHMSKENKKFSDRESISSSDHESSRTHFTQRNEPSQSVQGDKDSQPSSTNSAETFKDEAIRRIKLDMAEKRFCYIPPRVHRRKRLDYLHYARKKDEGALTYVAHADYYILLRACARIAEVDIRIMHIGVLSLEKTMSWLENRIDQCLHLTSPVVSCQFCSDVGLEAAIDSVGLSELNI